jgi:hypothetical protein
MENGASLPKPFIHNSKRWKKFKGNSVTEFWKLIYLNTSREVEMGKVSPVLIIKYYAMKAYGRMDV